VFTLDCETPPEGLTKASVPDARARRNTRAKLKRDDIAWSRIERNIAHFRQKKMDDRVFVSYLLFFSVSKDDNSIENRKYDG
jgi:hypothetical protein